MSLDFVPPDPSPACAGRHDGAFDSLVRFVSRHPRLLVLTGAGCSTGSGIPDYRDADGRWKHRRPVSFADFTASPAIRRRYWAGSLVGWPHVHAARPNPAHDALARLEARGRIPTLVTQNVDGLHQKAGSRRVIDLHGRLDVVECLACGATLDRADLQTLLLRWNPGFGGLAAADAPDGDARIEAVDHATLRVPDCPECGGVLKPGVVFFGESVPRHRVEAVERALEAVDAVLVVGTSLMVWSGYRFCLAARALGRPIAAVNRGRTRADPLLDLRVADDCAAVLPRLAALP